MKGAGLLVVVALTGCNLDALKERSVAYACDRDAGDENACAPGWRCGYGNVCFEVDAGAPRVCWGDADCAQGWRCGVKPVGDLRHCQDRDAGQAYPCQRNDDCEQGWKCNPLAQQCTDVDEVVGAGGADQLEPLLISPRLDAGQPLMLATGQEVEGFHLPQNGGDTSLRPFAMLYPGVLRLIVWGTKLPNPEGGRDQPPVWEGQLPIDETQVRELAVLGPWVLVRFADGAVHAWQADLGHQGGAWVPDAGHLQLPVTAASLRSVNTTGSTGVRASVNQQPTVVVTGAGDAGISGLWRYHLASDGGLESQQSDVGSPIVDISPMSSLAGDPVVLLGDGLSVSGATAPAVFTGFSRVISASSEANTPFPSALLGDALPDGGMPARWRVAAANGPNAVYGASQASCPVCPDERPPLAINPTYTKDNQGLNALTRCAAVPDAGIPEASFVVNFASANGTCTTSNVRFSQLDDGHSTYAFGFTPSRDVPRSHAGRDGRLWFVHDVDGGISTGSELPQPLLLDRAPSFLVRIDAIIGHSVYALSAGTFFALAPDYGLAAEDSTMPIVGQVGGHPQWIISTRQVYDFSNFPLNSENPRLLAGLPDGVPDLTAPATGAVVTLPDGRTILSVTARDTIYVADVTQALSSNFTSSAELTPRLVPNPGLTLRSITLRPGPDGVSLEGYAITDSSTYALSAPTLDRWSSRAVDVYGGLPLRVWNEPSAQDGGLQWRIGTNDGLVRTLPTSVALSQQLDAGTTDYARLCGTVLASGPAGLYRLNPGPSGTLPAWVRVAVPDFPDTEWPGARLVESNASVFVTSTTGRVVELSRGFDGGQPSVCP